MAEWGSYTSAKAHAQGRKDGEGLGIGNVAGQRARVPTREGEIVPFIEGMGYAARAEVDGIGAQCEVTINGIEVQCATYLERWSDIPSTIPLYDPPRLPFWLYLAVAGLIGAGEFLLLLGVLQVMNETWQVTYGTALGLGVLLPLSAHFVGEELREGASSNVRTAAVISSMVFVLMLATNAIRALRFGDIGGYPVWGWMAIYLAISIGLFALAVWASRSTESVRIRNERRLRAERDQLESRIGATSDRIANEFIKARQRANDVIAAYRGFVADYRGANAEARGGACPEFRVEEVQLPSALGAADPPPLSFSPRHVALWNRFCDDFAIDDADGDAIPGDSGSNSDVSIAGGELDETPPVM